MPGNAYTLDDGDDINQSGEETIELLDNNVHHGSHPPIFESSFYSGGTSVVEEDDAFHAETLSYWKRPSPWWALWVVPILMAVDSATIAPRIEVYTSLACRVHKPEVFQQSFSSISFGKLPNTTLSQENNIQPNIPYLCASEPIVQAAVATLTTVIAVATGVSSCISAVWWGGVSDRKGRVYVMGVSMFGQLLTNLTFHFVTLFPNLSPGGYWFLALGPFIQGCLGGVPSMVSAIYAYLADTGPESSRSWLFSLGDGLAYAGMATGSFLGALLIRQTGQVLSVFYVKTSVELAYFILLLTITPESLTKQQMRTSTRKYRQDLEDIVQNPETNLAVGLLSKFKTMFSFLSSLSIFLPVEKKGENALEQSAKDWSLTLLVLGFGMRACLTGSADNYRYQYAAKNFAWNSETLGSWISLNSITNSLFLMIILPLIIKYLKPKVISTPTKLLTVWSPSIDGPVGHQREGHPSMFDLWLAQASLAVEVVGLAGFAVVTTAPPFIILSLAMSLGSGFEAAMRSFILSLYTRQGGTESGRLFGALSLFSSVCAEVLGPALYGIVYTETVADSPRSIFVLGFANKLLALGLLGLIRVPSNRTSSHILLEDLDPELEA